jgi:hypothetical protein
MDGHSLPFQSLFAEYLTGLADWRRSRYQDDLRDPRNLVSADGIQELAAHFRSLPDDDARVVELNRLMRVGEQLEVGQRTSYEVGRFRFFTPETELDQYVDQIVELARFDRNERGHFGGKMAPGDDPWG